MLTGWANEIGESDPRLDYVRGVLANRSTWSGSGGCSMLRRERLLRARRLGGALTELRGARPTTGRHCAKLPRMQGG